MKKLITLIIVVFPQLLTATELATCINIHEKEETRIPWVDEIFVWSDKDHLTKIMWRGTVSTFEIDCLISEVTNENYCFQENFDHSYPEKIDYSIVSVEFNSDTKNFNFEYQTSYLSFDEETNMPIKSKIRSSWLGFFDCDYPNNLKFLDYDD